MQGRITGRSEVNPVSIQLQLSNFCDSNVCLVDPIWIGRIITGLRFMVGGASAEINAVPDNG